MSLQSLKKFSELFHRLVPLCAGQLVVTTQQDQSNEIGVQYMLNLSNAFNSKSMHQCVFPWGNKMRADYLFRKKYICGNFSDYRSRTKSFSHKEFSVIYGNVENI